MFLKRHPIAWTAACAVVSLLLAADPASAARGPSGGYRGGSSYGGYRGGWDGGYRGGSWGGGRSYGGYAPGYFGGYNSGYYNNYYSPGVILDRGSYDNDYYAPPAVDYTTPSYYYSPSTTPETIAVPDDRARIEVLLPAPDAEVFFDGAATKQQGTDRTFVSPPLTGGKTFTYNIEARWMENGRSVDMTKSVTVTAGQSAAVDFGR